MNERPYLSIGDVLTLLRQEFPDITISKIRFLESRGLLVPERTPSGYRKFYDHDVDRLRWILRQQRENFLPLKVIKGRLEGQEPSSEPTPLFEVADSDASPLEPAFAGPSLNGLTTRADEAPVTTHGSYSRHGGIAPVLAGPAAAAGAALREASSATERSAVSEKLHGRVATAVPDGAEPPVGVPPVGEETAGEETAGEKAAGEKAAGEKAAGVPAAGPGPGGLPGHETPASASPVAPRTGHSAVTRQAAAAGAVATAGHPAGGETTGHPRPATAQAARASEEASARVPEDRDDAGRERHERRPGHSDKAKAAGAPSGADAAALAGASLTAAELAQASGLEIRQVEQLESYGLVESRMVAGVRCFDEDALIVAKLAAGFAAFGVEARHLRLFKHAAERQASLYSQVVMPLLRQRNPEARRRAHEDLVQLSELGASLQTCFTKAVLRDLTRG